MIFATVIRNAREKRGWGTRKLAFKSDVTHSTISRIEARKNEPTLLVAIRLMQTLDIEPQDLFPDIEVISPLKSNANALRISDLQCLKKEQEQACRWLASSLNSVYGALGENPQFTSNAIRLSLQDKFPKSYNQIRYPNGLTAKQIRQIFLDGGVVTPHDVKAFIDRLPEKIEMTSLDRLLLEAAIETAREARSSLTDSLFSMLWSAYSYQDKVWEGNPYPPDLERRLIEDCVLTYRWAESLGIAESLRATLNKSG